MKPQQYRQLRVRLTLATFVISALLAAGAVWGMLAVLQAQTDQTISDRLTERSTTLASGISTRHGSVDVTDDDSTLFDGPNWIYDPTGTRIGGPAAGGALGARLQVLAATRTVQVVTEGRWHLRAFPITDHGALLAVGVTGVDAAPYDATLNAVAAAGILLAGAAVIGATVLTAIVLARSLGPIVTMTEQAAKWSRTETRGRFRLGPSRDEVTRLATVLDELLDRVDSTLEAERRLTAEIAHELRTPLTLVSGEAQLALRSSTTPPSQRLRYERIQQAADAMARAVTALLADADAAATGDVHADTVEAVHLASQTLDPPIDVIVHGHAPAAAVPTAVLERILAPLLANAAAVATHATVTISADQDTIRLHVHDDGPGIDGRVTGTLFAPGSTTRPGGTGLGLPLARRLARDFGGDLTLIRPRPATFEITLPAATDTHLETPAPAAPVLP